MHAAGALPGRLDVRAQGPDHTSNGNQLLAEYRQLHSMGQYAPSPHASSTFRTFFRKQGRPLVRPATALPCPIPRLAPSLSALLRPLLPHREHPKVDRGLALLNTTWQKWFSSNPVCPRAGELMCDKLKQVHDSTLALVATGYLEGAL